MPALPSCPNLTNVVVHQQSIVNHVAIYCGGVDAGEAAGRDSGRVNDKKRCRETKVQLQCNRLQKMEREKKKERECRTYI